MYAGIISILALNLKFIFQVVPLVDALYTDFFPHIIYCSVYGNEEMYNKIVQAGYKTIRYYHQSNNTLGPKGFLSYK